MSKDVIAKASMIADNGGSSMDGINGYSGITRSMSGKICTFIYFSTYQGVPMVLAISPSIDDIGNIDSYGNFKNIQEVNLDELQFYTKIAISQFEF